jgi:hypothetical protein
MSTRATARSTSPSGRTTAPRTTTPRSTAHRTGGAPRVAPRAGTRTAPRPELRLVPGVPASRPRRRPASLLRHRRAPFVLLVVALLVGTTLGLLVLNTAIAVDSLKATQLRTANAERAEQLQSLEQQVVSGSTPAEIARAAAAAGMVPAGVAAHLVIQRDGSSVLRGTPQPAPAAGDAEGGN